MIPKWFDKSPQRSNADNIADLRTALAAATAAYTSQHRPSTAFGHAAEHYRAIIDTGAATGLNALTASYGAALIDRALLDALCRALDVPFATAIRDNLAERNVEVSRFEITDISYTHEFENSVEQKVIAQQKAIEEQNRTKQIEEQARQKVLSAEAEAKSMQIRAQALEQNAKLVEWEAVQKWNGVLPQYMLGGGAVPFINIKTGKE
jgi:regulator of protease activity HflC (stomatin/prohibitin superfamily)